MVEACGKGYCLMVDRNGGEGRNQVEPQKASNSDSLSSTKPYPLRFLPPLKTVPSVGTKCSKHEPMGDISTSKPSIGSPRNKEQRLLWREFHRGPKADMEWPRAVWESRQLERQRNERFFSNPIGRNAVQRPALLFMENSNGIEAPV